MSILVERLIDTRPLRENAKFRRLWIGTTMLSLGKQFTSLAVLFQVWEMTQSPFWTGLVGIVNAVPTILFGATGGAFADIMDRRKLVLCTTVGALAVAALLALQAVFELNSIALLFVLVAAQVAFTSFGNPARTTFVPRLLTKEQIGAGLALVHLSSQGTMLLGPALAGLIIAGWGVAACYIVEVFAFCAAFYGVAGLPEMKPQNAKATNGLIAIPDGLRFIRGRPLLSGSLLSDLSATFLAMPFALFPAINAMNFGGRPETLGLFMSAVAVGGITAAALSGWFTRVVHVGRVQLAAAALWGMALLGAGLSVDLLAVLIMLAVAGAADTAAVISRGTLLQIATPDEYRGRVSSVEQIVGIAGPDLGNFRAGLVASMFGPMNALAIGGGLCVVAVVSIAIGNPALRQFSREANASAGDPTDSPSS